MFASDRACSDCHDGDPTPRIDQLYHPGQIDETSTNEGGQIEALNIRIFLKLGAFNGYSILMVVIVIVD